MIRTVWLTVACLVVLGGVLLGKALETPGAMATVTLMNATTIGAGSVQEPLIKADRLEFVGVAREGPAQSAVRAPEPLIAAPAIVRPGEPEIVTRHRHGSNATTSSARTSKQPARPVPTKRAGSVDPNGRRAADRARPVGQAKPCSRTGAFGDLLRSLKLSPACVS